MRAAYTPPTLIRSTAVIGQAIASGPVPPYQGPYSGNWTAETDAWSAYAAALAAEPQAEPDFVDRPVSPPSTPLPVNAA